MNNYFYSHQGGLIMSPYYKFDFGLGEVFEGPRNERNLLRVYTGDNISETEAVNLWKKIAEHKWYVSERLSRDIGFHVAAIDYVENFYEPRSGQKFEEKVAESFRKIWRRVAPVLRSYFEAKGSTLPI